MLRRCTAGTRAATRRLQRLEESSAEYAAPCFTFTVVGRVRDVASALGVLPVADLHVVRHERRDVTLEHGRVALYHKHIVHLRLVVLIHHCNSNTTPAGQDSDVPGVVPVGGGGLVPAGDEMR